MTIGTAADVEASLARALTASEASHVDALLHKAELKLQSRIPDLVTRAAVDETFQANVGSVEGDIVARVLRNPDGLKSESDGTISYSADWTVALGRVTVLDEEWAQLGLGTRLRGIAPTLDAYAQGRLAGDPAYQFQNGWPGGGSPAVSNVWP